MSPASILIRLLVERSSLGQIDRACFLCSLSSSALDEDALRREQAATINDNKNAKRGLQRNWTEACLARLAMPRLHISSSLRGLWRRWRPATSSARRDGWRAAAGSVGQGARARRWTWLVAWRRRSARLPSACLWYCLRAHASARCRLSYRSVSAARGMLGVLQDPGNDRDIVPSQWSLDCTRAIGLDRPRCGCTRDVERRAGRAPSTVRRATTRCVLPSAQRALGIRRVCSLASRRSAFEASIPSPAVLMSIYSTRVQPDTSMDDGEESTAAAAAGSDHQERKQAGTTRHEHLQRIQRQHILVAPLCIGQASSSSSMMHAHAIAPLPTLSGGLPRPHSRMGEATDEVASVMPPTPMHRQRSDGVSSNMHTPAHHTHHREGRSSQSPLQSPRSRSPPHAEGLLGGLAGLISHSASQSQEALDETLSQRVLASEPADEDDDHDERVATQEVKALGEAISMAPGPGSKGRRSENK